MKPAAMGVRMHSGWGVLVAVASENGRPNVIARERIEVVDGKAGGKKQPYHFARTMSLGSAEKYLAKCAEDSERLAGAAIRTLSVSLQERGFRLARCAVLTGAGRALPELSKILAAHPLVHTAEGEFFREAICAACLNMKIAVTRVRERELEKTAKELLGRAAVSAKKQIANAGKALGSPWTQEHKNAALAAWMILN
jgi:hypothetical protein